MSDDDLIRRGDAIKALKEYWSKYTLPVMPGMQGALCTGVLNSIPAVQVEPEWIPVKKALPENNMPVWVTTEWGEVTDGERWSDCKWFIGCGERNACDDDILAWMPYYSPKPYKGETP